LAALRVGYVVGPEWIIADLEIAVLPYHLDSFKQAATTLALTFTTEMEERVALIKSERSRIEAALSSLDIEVWPSGANFVLFRPRHGKASEMWAQLLQHGVLVRDCSSWPGLDGCLRVTVGTGAENSTFLQAVASVMGQ
jgi:histidinol-phosphate aminotransferase